MKNPRNKKVITLVLTSLSILLLLYGIFLYGMASFLSLNQPVDSRILILESWISPFEAESALPLLLSDSTDKIFIVGTNYSDDGEHIKSLYEQYFNRLSSGRSDSNPGVWLLTGSGLFINTSIFKEVKPEDSIRISVRVKSYSDFDFPAHFSLVINGRCVGSAFAGKSDQEMIFRTILTDSLRTLSLFFDNDSYDGKRDRNLFISGVSINGIDCPVNEGNSFLVKEFGQTVNGCESQPTEMANYLTDLGVDPKRMEMIGYDPGKSNKTLAGALAFSNHPSAAGIASVNVISSGLHSRRSRVTYQRILGDKITVGVVNQVPTMLLKGKPNNIASSFYYLNNETIAYMFNWIHLVFGNKMK